MNVADPGGPESFGKQLWAGLPSFFVVGLLAAGCGAVFGYYLTGAMGAPEPPPETPPQREEFRVDPEEENVLPAAGGEVDRVFEIPGRSQSVFVIQLGAFTQRTGAEERIEAMRAVGLDAAWIAGRPHRVWAGLFPEREPAQAYLERFTVQGFEGFVQARRLETGGSIRSKDPTWAQSFRNAVAELPESLRSTAALWLPGRFPDPPTDALIRSLRMHRDGLRAEPAGPAQEHPAQEHREIAARLQEVYGSLLVLAERATREPPSSANDVPPDVMAAFAGLLGNAEAILEELSR